MRKVSVHAMAVARCCVVVWSAHALAGVASGQPVSFERNGPRMDIMVNATRIATYVWEDAAIPRPYFSNLTAPNGYPVTRNHPPDPDIDAGNEDHATYHPGMWMAFGDFGGVDFWRLRATVRHAGFSVAPQGGEGGGHFEVRNMYETRDDPPRVIAEERARYTVRVTEHGYWIDCESRFTPSTPDIAFGDQEEMGLGVRLATHLTVKHGRGEIRNSEGGRNEAGTWGKQSDWCAGFAEDGDASVGVVVMPHPENFRASWFHSRDYGLIVANPFGEKAMTGPEDPEVTEARTPAADLALRFAVGVFHSTADPVTVIEQMVNAYTRAE